MRALDQQSRLVVSPVVPCIHLLNRCADPPRVSQIYRIPEGLIELRRLLHPPFLRLIGPCSRLTLTLQVRPSSLRISHTLITDTLAARAVKDVSTSVQQKEIVLTLYTDEPTGRYLSSDLHIVSV